MDTETRDLLEEALGRLVEYRDGCEDDGMVSIVKAVDALREKIQVKLDNTVATLPIDHTHLIDLRTVKGEYASFEDLQKEIFARTLLNSTSSTEACARLRVSRSTIYRNVRAFNLQSPARRRSKA